MKKLTIKETKTFINFLTTSVADNGEMTVVPGTVVLNGKVSEKNAIKHLENVSYLTGTVEVKTETRKLQIPYGVVADLIDATVNNRFVTSEDTMFSMFDLKKEFYVKTEISTLMREVLIMTDSKEEATEMFGTDFMNIKQIDIPFDVFTGLIRDYTIISETREY